MNGLLFYKVLLENEVSAPLHAFPQGVNAIALRNSSGSTAYWTVGCKAWLEEMKILMLLLGK